LRITARRSPIVVAASRSCVTSIVVTPRLRWSSKTSARLWTRQLAAGVGERLVPEPSSISRSSPARVPSSWFFDTLSSAIRPVAQLLGRESGGSRADLAGLGSV
jgi:hypothetical protein